MKKVIKLNAEELWDKLQSAKAVLETRDVYKRYKEAEKNYKESFDYRNVESIKKLLDSALYPAKAKAKAKFEANGSQVGIMQANHMTVLYTNSPRLNTSMVKYEKGKKHDELLKKEKNRISAS